MTSSVTNNAAIGREAEFDMLLPKAAFITGIRIELQNETIHGVVEEKKKAEKIYQRVRKLILLQPSQPNANGVIDRRIHSMKCVRAFH